MNAYGEPDVGNLLVRFDEDLRGRQSAFLSGYSTVLSGKKYILRPR
jgi:hypothetical protein